MNRRTYAALAAAAALLAGCTSGAGRPAPMASETTPLMAGNGYVVRRAGQPDRFCERRYETAIGNPKPPECLAGMEVAGVRFEELDREYSWEGVRWRIGRLEGTVVGGVFHVVRQGKWREPTIEALLVPEGCGAPRGGWPVYTEPDRAALVDWAERHAADYVGERRAVDPRDPRRGVYVVTTHAPDAAAAALRPVYGDRLCILASRYTRAEVAAAREAARRFAPYPHVVHEQLGPDAQLTLEVDPVMVGEAERAFAAGQPDGLIVFNPWLAPPEAANAVVRKVRAHGATIAAEYSHDTCSEPAGVAVEETRTEVRISARARATSAAAACPKAGVTAYAGVTLAAPLGTRTVVDVFTGQAVEDVR